MAIKNWISVYPIGIDGLSEMPTIIDDEDDALVSQILSVRDVVIQLEEYVGTETPESGTLRGRVANLETISGTVVAHAESHKSGGADTIKLDELAAPTDNTDLDASTSTHGLLPKLSNVSTEYLNGVGAWSTPADAVTICG